MEYIFKHYNITNRVPLGIIIRMQWFIAINLKRIISIHQFMGWWIKRDEPSYFVSLLYLYVYMNTSLFFFYHTRVLGKNVSNFHIISIGNRTQPIAFFSGFLGNFQNNCETLFYSFSQNIEFTTIPFCTKLLSIILWKFI